MSESGSMVTARQVEMHKLLGRAVTGRNVPVESLAAFSELVDSCLDFALVQKAITREIGNATSQMHAL
ncbi:hypothetical protein [Candidatus Poriferisodalis sp.]|uniref:hypothetical protein n=1 Tax=Candidatus Poriferisodalis sp. TaxID=3101277 RepID=UPI003C704184